MANKKADKQTLFDTIAEDDKDFFILSLEKKVRNINKKLKEIKLLEVERKEGKELKEAQLSKIANKGELSDKIKEQESIARLYIEARAEHRAENTQAVSAPVAAALETVSQVFFAAQHAHQTNTFPELAAVYTTVFLNQAATRVQDAQARLTAFVSGAQSAQLTQAAAVVASENFLAQPVAESTVHVTEVEQTVIVTKVVPEVVAKKEKKPAPAAKVVAPQPAVVVAAPQPVVVVAPQPVVVEEQVQIVVPAPVEVQQQAATTDAAQVNTNVAQTTVVTEAPVVADATNQEAATEQNGDKKPRRNNGPRKPRDENYVPREKKPREPRAPREPLAEGQENVATENQQPVGEQKPRAPRQPRQNRPPKTAEGASDGWNVVKPASNNQEGGYHKTRAQNRDRAPREGGNNNSNNRNNQNRRPFNPENRKPANKDEQYVRKDQTHAVQKTSEPQAAQTN